LRLARATAHVALSEVIAYRALWAGVEKKPNAGFGPMAKLFSSEKFLKDASDLLNSPRRNPVQALGTGWLLDQCYPAFAGDHDLWRDERDPSSMIAERALQLPRTRA